MKKNPLIIGRTPEQRAIGIMNLLGQKCWIAHYVTIPAIVRKSMTAWIAAELEIAYNAGRIDQIGETVEQVKQAIA